MRVNNDDRQISVLKFTHLGTGLHTEHIVPRDDSTCKSKPFGSILQIDFNSLQEVDSFINALTLHRKQIINLIGYVVLN